MAVRRRMEKLKKAKREAVLDLSTFPEFLDNADDMLRKQDILHELNEINKSKYSESCP